MTMAVKTPLVLLPGLLNDAALWAHQIETLADIAESSVGDLSQDDSVGAMAARVLDAAPERFALAGLSMGGYVAQEIMRRAPQRVIKLALLDTNYLADAPEQSERRRGLIELSRKGQFKGVTPRLLPLLISPSHQDNEDLKAIIIDMAGRIGMEAFIRQQTAIMHRPDGTGDLERIQCPTLVLCGREDALTPPDLHAKMADRIPGATFVAVEDAGHLSPLEQPQAVSAVMRYWLGG